MWKLLTTSNYITNLLESKSALQRIIAECQKQSDKIYL